MSLCYFFIVLFSAVFLGCTAFPIASKSVEWNIPRLIPSKKYNLMVLHATIGNFPFKKRSGYWGYGQDILLEILDKILDSGLISHIDAVYFSLLGDSDGRNQVVSSLAARNVSQKLFIACSDSLVSLAEFPALYFVEQIAMNIHPNSKIFYGHTKGVRKNGIGSYPSDWRKYMVYFTIEKYYLCFLALDKLGYKSCGVLKQRIIYAGNFWWSKASHLQSKKYSVRSIPWNMDHRYEAEEYLLKSSYFPKIINWTDIQVNHYCIHHAHHDMQNCPTPRHFYDSASLLQIYEKPNCFFPALLPKNRTKDPQSWCHHDKLPSLPRNVLLKA